MSDDQQQGKGTTNDSEYDVIRRDDPRLQPPGRGPRTRIV